MTKRISALTTKQKQKYIDWISTTYAKYYRYDIIGDQPAHPDAHRYYKDGLIFGTQKANTGLAELGESFGGFSTWKDQASYVNPGLFNRQNRTQLLQKQWGDPTPTLPHQSVASSDIIFSASPIRNLNATAQHILTAHYAELDKTPNFWFLPYQQTLTTVIISKITSKLNMGNGPLTPQELKDLPLWKLIKAYKKDSAFKTKADVEPQHILWTKLFQWIYYKQLDSWNKNVKRLTKIFQSELNSIEYYANGIYFTVLMPRYTLKSYWSNTQLWVIPAQFEVLKDQKYIVWDALNKNWIWKPNTVIYLQLLPNYKTQTIFANETLTKKQHKPKVCPSCKLNWLNAEWTEQPQLEESICQDCIIIPVEPNQSPTAKTAVLGYHEHEDTWKFYVQRSPKDKFKALPMGVELEVYQKTFSHYPINEAIMKLFQLQQEKDLGHNFFCERDGSLSQYGVEFITNPMTLLYHQHYWATMLPEIRKDFVGWNTGNIKGVYGIHITMHRNYWSDLNLSRFTRFINDPQNQTFIHAIAQRRMIYSQTVEIAAVKKQMSELLPIKGKKLKGNTKYSAVHLKENRPHIEVRMFQSTTNQTSFMKNLEFLDSFWLWCKTTPYNIDHKSYLQWLISTTKFHYRYPNLLAYLSKDHFPVKGNTAIPNQWLDIINTTGLKVTLPPAVIAANAVNQDVEEFA